MNPHDMEYSWAAEEIMARGDWAEGRNGRTLSATGISSTYDLRQGFPLLTTKKVNFDAVVAELLWFISGRCHTTETLDSKIWDQWADEKGRLGPIYGAQWRFWLEVDGLGTWKANDQLTQAIKLIKAGPTRRALVSAWNVADLPDMALPPCHFAFQLHRYKGHGDLGKDQLDLTLYQRSADWCVGVPFNIASYALLAHLIANECDLSPRYLHCHYGDAHIYEEHLPALREQLERSSYKPPTLAQLPPYKPVVDIEADDIEIHDYQHHPFIKYEVKK